MLPTPRQVRTELRWAGPALCPGPHRAIRHPALSAIWWRCSGGKEELAWARLWEALAASASASTSSGALLDELGPPDELRALSRDRSVQEAVQRAVEEGSASLTNTGYVTPAMLDMAMAPGRSLVETLRGLVGPVGTAGGCWWVSRGPVWKGYQVIL